MTPLEQKVIDLETKVTELQTQLSHFTMAPNYDPDTIRALGKVVFRSSDASPSSYDQEVNESGSANYNVAAVPDGFVSLPDGKIIPYYNV